MWHFELNQWILDLSLNQQLSKMDYYMDLVEKLHIFLPIDDVTNTHDHQRICISAGMLIANLPQRFNKNTDLIFDINSNQAESDIINFSYALFFENRSFVFNNLQL